MNALTDEAFAWNRMVEQSLHAASLAPDGPWRLAAIACLFMSETASGGLNGFLDVCHDISGTEAVAALQALGATEAAMELQAVLDHLGTVIEVTTGERRRALLDSCWTEDMDDLDTLSQSAFEQLEICLEQHVRIHKAHYLARPAGLLG